LGIQQDHIVGTLQEFAPVGHDFVFGWLDEADSDKHSWLLRLVLAIA
jgi:hypothetical protein